MRRFVSVGIALPGLFFACGGSTEATESSTPTPSASTSSTTSPPSSGYGCAKGGYCEGAQFDSEADCKKAYEICEPYRVCGGRPWCGRGTCKNEPKCDPGHTDVTATGCPNAPEDGGAEDGGDAGPAGPCYTRTGCKKTITCATQ